MFGLERGYNQEKASHWHSACSTCDFLIVLRARIILLSYKSLYIAENLVISATQIFIKEQWENRNYLSIAGAFWSYIGRVKVLVKELALLNF